MRKLKKYDRKFLISQIALVILCVLRVSKWKKYDHSARILLLDDYDFTLIVSVVMCIALFLLYMFVLKRVDEGMRNKTFYVIMLVTVMLYPTYAHSRYMGAMDIYGLILGVISIVLIVTEFCEWIDIILMGMAVFINPMCIFSMGVIVPLVLLYKFLVKEDTKRLVICICLCIVEVVGFFASRMMGMFAVDERELIDIRKFIVILVFLTPFIFVACLTFINLIKNSKRTNDKVYYILSAFTGVSSFVVWTIRGDYTRAIVNLFICYGVWLLVMMSYRDELLSEQMDSLSVKIKKWVPISGVIVIYVLAIMLYWMCGVESVSKEVLLELVVEQ